MRVAILAPIASSLYSRLVAHLVAQIDNVAVVGVAIKTPWSLKRVQSEFHRDGVRLLVKAYRQLVLGERDFDQSTTEHLLGLAKEHNLPGRSLRHWCRLADVPCETFGDHNDRGCVDFLRATKPDIIAFTGGGLIRSALLETPTKGILNCHMGPLPRYRGLDVVEYPAVERRLTEEGTGLTLQFMDAGIDTGPILIEQPVTPRPGETFAHLRRRMQREMVQVMMRGIEGLGKGTIEPRTQNVGDGRQYFVMHPRVRNLAARVLSEITAVPALDAPSTVGRRSAA